jgi:hypothetical protein
MSCDEPTNVMFSLKKNSKMKTTMFACSSTLTQFPSSPTKHADPSASQFHASYISFLFSIKNTL